MSDSVKQKIDYIRHKFIERTAIDPDALFLNPVDYRGLLSEINAIQLTPSKRNNGGLVYLNMEVEQAYGKGEPVCGLHNQKTKEVGSE